MHVINNDIFKHTVPPIALGWYKTLETQPFLHGSSHWSWVTTKSNISLVINLMLYPTNHSSFLQGTEGYPSNHGFNKSSPKLFYLFIRARGIQTWVWLCRDVLPLRISPGTTCTRFYSQSRRPTLDPELKSNSTSGHSSKFPSTQQMIQTGSEVFLWLHSKVYSDHGSSLPGPLILSLPL